MHYINKDCPLPVRAHYVGGITGDTLLHGVEHVRLALHDSSEFYKVKLCAMAAE